MTALLISDLHLSAGDTETIRRFTSFMDGAARDASDLYILGDLFEAWIGDDEDDRRLAVVIQTLQRLTAAGVGCAVMHGNRDFLLGERFAAATGCRLLAEFERIELGGEPVLLTHGDLLCSDDVRYLTLRATLRDPHWQREFLDKPLAERRAIAADLRRMSATEIAAKPEDIMDVNQGTVEATMRRFEVARLVHGHTHRPAIHRFMLDGHAATRLVLGAWHERASVASWSDARGFTLQEL
jgi:UDP-2,3-diacylglucosamine hydrolase